MRSRLLIACCSAAIALAGCGGDGPSDETKVKEAIVAYYKAFANGDGKTACALLTEKTRDGLEQAGGGKKCPALLKEALKRPDYAKVTDKLGDVKVTDVKISGNTALATAEIPGLKASDGKTPISTSVPLAKEGGDWKIASPLGQG